MTTPSELTLDEETHIYRLDGRRLVSVTQALSLVDDRRKDPYYLQRGKFVHLACELWDKGELDEVPLDPQLLPYFDAYRKFEKETEFTPGLIECKLYHPVSLYAGTIDRTGDLNGHHILVDLKSGARARVDELQGAAYWELCRVNKIPADKVFDLYLHDDGTYKLEPIENPKRLFPSFLNVLGAYRWKEKL